MRGEGKGDGKGNGKGMGREEGREGNGKVVMCSFETDRKRLKYRGRVLLQ